MRDFTFYIHALLATCILVALGGMGFIAYSWQPAIQPIARPDPHIFPRDQIERGRIIADEGFCAECHTPAGNKDPNLELSGNFRMQTPFGAIYSSNITPDTQTGIGNWSEDAFKRAMRKGVTRNGKHLIPAFPYDHFTKMTDEDIADLYAYLMSRKAIHVQKYPNGLFFPLNFRIFQAGWQFMFFKPGVYQPDQQKDALWNRGAYLAEGDAHCGACHTPRNLFGAEKKSKLYEGAIVDGWIAPPLTRHNPTPTSWTEDEIFDYLRYGTAPLHGPAAGPMSPVVHNFLEKVPDYDVRAIAHYFASFTDGQKRHDTNNARMQELLKSSDHDQTDYRKDPDARLYESACAACHYNAAPAPKSGRPDLALNSTLWLDEPTNLYQVMLRGITAPEGQKAISMPSFYQALSDKDMARIAQWLRLHRTNLPPWQDLEAKAAQVRKTVEPMPINSSH